MRNGDWEVWESVAMRIVSEDLNAGQVIAGIRIENPFSLRT